MTINVAVLTNQALVFGCDSVASSTQPMLDPFQLPWKRDAEGKAQRTPEGKFVLEFDFGNVTQIVTDVVSGVTKMFCLHTDTPVVAVTAGAGTLKARTISSFGNEFHEKFNATHLSVEEVARAFFEFMKKVYEETFASDQQVLKIDLDFLVGGISYDQDFPELYRLKIKDDQFTKEFGPGESGMSYNGQAGSIERMLRGYDVLLRYNVAMHYKRALEDLNREYVNALSRIVNELLEKSGATMPDDVSLDLPNTEATEPNWNDFRLPIDYANMPLQMAIDFAAFLVNLESGSQRYRRGIPTVGGRTHIGLVTKSQGFQIINPPELRHQNTGFE
jgi:hypothetical protein